MRHLGDITKINGGEIEPVDIITGGSPRQDLSVAGKRAGLAGERSGLFMEQIRIVKEMREADVRRGRTGQLIRPRFLVWENVVGAFSSNGGRDFQAVLTEIIRIAEPSVPDVPLPPKGKWPMADAYFGDGYSIAYRVHDAQFWGVPQRRRRIALVADFGGYAAPEVLFEREGVSGDSEPCGAPREEAAGDAGSGAGHAISFQERDGKPGGGKGILIQDEHVGALSTLNNQSVFSYPTVANTLSARHDGSPQPDKGNGANIVVQEPTYCVEKAPSLLAGQESAVYDARGNGDGKTVCTLTGDHQDRVTDYTALCVGNGQLHQVSMAEQSNTLDTMHDQQAVLVAAVDCRNGTENATVNGTLQAKSSGGMSVNLQNVCRCGSVVRRLTPLECTRLQGYPDGRVDIGDWTDSGGKKHKDADSPRYKALGNSIALPFWYWLLRRISALYAGTPTLGSLFDGIGGFPLCHARVNGPRSVRWASEIEEFPMAVTRRHFGDEDAGVEGDIMDFLWR